jgi:RNA recognition motif-containing protein
VSTRISGKNYFLTFVGRDRENSTVFVADLPKGTTEEELTALFNDVSNILHLWPSSEVSGTVRESAGSQIYAVAGLVSGYG